MERRTSCELLPPCGLGLGPALIYKHFAVPIPGSNSPGAWTLGVWPNALVGTQKTFFLAPNGN